MYLVSFFRVAGALKLLQPELVYESNEGCKQDAERVVQLNHRKIECVRYVSSTPYPD